ncbi:PhnD/SsuA/transferrin family substrate-binding protein [Calditerrivibrio nitroreducens]|uniref:ABC transporter, substrate-binding protein, putative n=1 Tax=Calditerrivibrio nitroreducens (strain DSM 19672 / NBRC 101217 / Yu37-1) TaxID=768670 RepID=E4TF14_CALNY|nr:PhnD/SsuA/transferrin family substrate-binding protein [Calditerrivibrio nitroreducens]ADR19454.1 ABC transporter, substrate-binding protein, putative [Calditerrivibrio nitroreducens DSM 19672]
MRRLLIILFLFVPLTILSKEQYIYSAVSLGNHESTIAQHKPLLDYISDRLNKKIKIAYYENHRELVEMFIKKDVDIAYLGPVPFIALKRKYINFEPLVLVKEKDGNSSYRCVLFAPIDESDPLKKIKNIAMTNPLSTCGYTFVYSALKKEGIDLESIPYSYIGNHEEVAKKVIAGLYNVGATKEDIFEKYKNLGLKSVIISDELPAFIIVANKKTMTQNDINLIRNSLLNIPKDKLSILKTGKYGFDRYDESKYINFEKLLDNNILKRIYE